MNVIYTKKKKKKKNLPKMLILTNNVKCPRNFVRYNRYNVKCNFTFRLKIKYVNKLLFEYSDVYTQKREKIFKLKNSN